MKVYTASRFGNYRVVRAFNDALRAAGHEVTHDWTRTSEFDLAGDPIFGDGTGLSRDMQAQHATADLDAVAAADAVVLLPMPDMGGAYIEIGYALAHDKHVFVAGPVRFTIFWALPNVTMLPDEAAVREMFGMAVAA